MADRVASLGLEPMASLVPLLPGAREQRLRAVSCGTAARIRAPALAGLHEHALTQLVTGPCEREGGVRVQALDAAAGPASPDPGVELRPQAPLLLVSALEARAERRIGRSLCGQAAYAARGLEPADGRDEPRTGQPESRGKRSAVGRPRFLLGYRRKPVGAADSHPPKGAGRTAELPRHNRTVVHAIMVDRRRSTSRPR
jgi:hypothetical protein